MRNGLNIASVSELVHEIKLYPEEALVRLAAGIEPLSTAITDVQVKTLSGGTTRVARDFRFFTSPVGERGARVANFRDHMLVALGGCVLVTFVQGCSARGFTIINAAVEVAAEFDSGGEGPHLGRIEYRYEVDCDGPPDALMEIATIVSCMSPNHRTFVEPGRVCLQVANGTDERVAERLLTSVSCAQRPVKPEVRRVRVAWAYGTQLQARTESGLEMLVDQPKQYLGLDSAPNPQEYLLGAAGAELCREVQVECQRRKVELRGIVVHCAGSINLLGLTNVDDSVPVRVHDLVQRVELAADEEAEQLGDLVEAAGARCLLHSAICGEHAIDVSLLSRSETIGKFRSDGAALEKNLAELSRRKEETSATERG